MIIDLAKLVNSKKTYPNWSSEKIYSLQTDCVDNKTLVVYYLTNSNKIVHRVFPKQITVNPSFAYVLGLIKGEGANALGKSNYRRFTFTNSNWQLVKLILDELMKQKLISESDIIERSTYILH
ncbi:hypothetical protein JW711_03855, partial [Candidatus Woesearchaeota archaeon]|nr:hypothetical protein [Candidatus Woesearchaeota archaeon]